LPAFAVLLLTSCTIPLDGPEDGGPVGAAISDIDPANDIFDLEEEGLKVLWRQELGQHRDDEIAHIYSTGDTVVLATAEGGVHCIDAETGTWRHGQYFAHALDHAPASIGHVLFLVNSNMLRSFDTDSRELSEPLSPMTSVSTPPVVFGDRVVLAGADGDLVLAKPQTRERSRMATLKGPILFPPVVAGEVVFAVAEDIMSLEVPDSVLWRWEPAEPSELSSGLAVSDDTVYVGDQRGYMYALEASLGIVKDRTMMDAPVVGQPLLAGGHLFVLTAKPSLFCMDTSGDGFKEIWCYGGPTELLSLGEEVAYVLNDDRTVAGVSLEEGKELWRHQLPENAMAIGADGRTALYVANTRGSVVALGELD
jgi:outer membrane protein assembly factor BamB